MLDKAAERASYVVLELMLAYPILLTHKISTMTGAMTKKNVKSTNRIAQCQLLTKRIRSDCQMLSVLNPSVGPISDATVHVSSLCFKSQVLHF